MAAPGLALALVALLSPSAAVATPGATPLGWPNGGHQSAELGVSGGGSVDDDLGYAVAVSGAGNTAAVSAYGTGGDVGSVYIFARSGKTWTQSAELTAPDGDINDHFGYSVAISRRGSTVVIGAPGHLSKTGAAYVFTDTGGTWTQAAEFTAPDGAQGDQFGATVGISPDGSTAMVGASYHDAGAGAAYAFGESGGTWAEDAELSPSDGAAGDRFGFSVSLGRHGEAVISAPGRSGYMGVAYVFTDSDGSWTQTAEFQASDGAAGDGFGYSVAMSTNGTTAVVGAVEKSTYTGAAYVFKDIDGTWTQTGELTASDGIPGSLFGYGTAISARGSTVVIGAPGFTTSTGAAYVYVARHGAAWTQRAELSGQDSVANDWFGNSVAVTGDGSTAIVGAPFHNNFVGAAYVFRR